VPEASGLSLDKNSLVHVLADFAMERWTALASPECLAAAKNPVSSTQPCRLFSSFPRDPRRRVARRKRLQRRFFDHVEFLVRILWDWHRFYFLALWFVHLLIPTLRSRTLPNASPLMISLWPSAHLSVLCVEFWNFITERAENRRGKFYWRTFSRSAFPSAIIFSISSGVRGRRAVSIL